MHAHVRLAWIFNCVARIGWLNRMTQFKDKAGKDREGVSVGLYVYPNLMAADILAYHATRVPVGDDQKQHLELANDIAQKFNHDYGVEFFPAIEPLIMGPAARVMSLRDGSQEDVQVRRVRPVAASTSPTTPTRSRSRSAAPRPTPSRCPPSPPASRAGPRRATSSASTRRWPTPTMPACCVSMGGRGFGAFKEALAALMVAKLAPIATETRRLLDDPGSIDAVLRQGAARAAAIADPIVAEAERLVGFLR